jgi:hypothetical protein
MVPDLAPIEPALSREEAFLRDEYFRNRIHIARANAGTREGMVRILAEKGIRCVATISGRKVTSLRYVSERKGLERTGSSLGAAYTWASLGKEADALQELRDMVALLMVAEDTDALNSFLSILAPAERRALGRPNKAGAAPVGAGPHPHSTTPPKPGRAHTAATLARGATGPRPVGKQKGQDDHVEKTSSPRSSHRFGRTR